ncbi:hypothetical protein SUGI_0825980 [Cryptomeria japonica]|nr:hypothetical protein SUGI_0825980 [Cryptomeria japonica]
MQKQLYSNGNFVDVGKESMGIVVQEEDFEIDLSSETEEDRALWVEHAVICRIVGPKKSRSCIKEWIAKHWAMGLVVKFLPRAFFVIVFAEGSKRNRVLHQENWFMEDYPLYIQPWKSNFDPLPLVVYDSLVWIRLYNLSIEYWGDNSLKKIGRSLGTLIEIDEKIIEEDLYSYARLRIAAVKSISYFIYLLTSEGKLRQHIEIEKEITPCHRCGSKFHFTIECKMFVRRERSNLVRSPKQNWVVKDIPTVQNPLYLTYEGPSGRDIRASVYVQNHNLHIDRDTIPSELPKIVMGKDSEIKSREVDAISQGSKNEFESLIHLA